MRVGVIPPPSEFTKSIHAWVATPLLCGLTVLCPPADGLGTRHRTLRAPPPPPRAPRTAAMGNCCAAEPPAAKLAPIKQGMKANWREAKWAAEAVSKDAEKAAAEAPAESPAEAQSPERARPQPDEPAATQQCQIDEHPAAGEGEADAADAPEAEAERPAPPAAGADQLRATFARAGATGRMGQREFTKMCKDCGLIDKQEVHAERRNNRKFTLNDADILFAKVTSAKGAGKAKGARDIDLACFLEQCVPAIAAKKGCAEDDVAARVAAGAPRTNGTTAIDVRVASLEASCGVYARGGPSSGATNPVDLAMAELTPSSSFPNAKTAAALRARPRSQSQSGRRSSSASLPPRRSA
eukprot:gene3936-4175_t